MNKFTSLKLRWWNPGWSFIVWCINNSLWITSWTRSFTSIWSNYLSKTSRYTNRNLILIMLLCCSTRQLKVCFSKIVCRTVWSLFKSSHSATVCFTWWPLLTCHCLFPTESNDSDLCFGQKWIMIRCRLWLCSRPCIQLLYFVTGNYKPGYTVY